MEPKTFTDPKIIKMFRRLEKFLDQEGVKEARTMSMQNAETRRVFAVFVSPEYFDLLNEYVRTIEGDMGEIRGLLKEALETIDELADDNALLALIDAQNDVLMGRLASAVEDAVDFPPDEKSTGVFNDAPPAEVDETDWKAKYEEKRSELSGILWDLFYDDRITLNEFRELVGEPPVPSGAMFYSGDTPKKTRHAFTSDAIRD